jgi:hypothetical protein
MAQQAIGIGIQIIISDIEHDMKMLIFILSMRG